MEQCWRCLHEKKLVVHPLVKFSYRRLGVANDFLHIGIDLLEIGAIKRFNPRLLMKIVQTSLALITLVALLLPCAHADEHHEHGAVVFDLCETNHAECHTCSDDLCTDTPVAASVFPVSEIPVRQIHRFTFFKTARPVFVAAPRPSGELQLLQTVQLLI